MSAIANAKPEVPTKNNSVKNAQKGQNKKRKRIKQSPEEQHLIESTDRYNKLHHACSKLLHREAKVVKSFECQKTVRAIKAANDSLSSHAQEGENDDGGKKELKNSTAKLSKRVQTLQQKLDRTKQMDLDVLVQVGLKRLGVMSLGPQKAGDATDENADIDKDVSAAEPAPIDIRENQSLTKSLDTKASSQSEDPFYKTLLESMLRHKRLSAALDALNEKVTEYRQWKMQREAMIRGEYSPEDYNMGGKKKKNKKNQLGKAAMGNDTMVVAGGFNSRKRGPDLGGHEGSSGLFIGSLSGIPAEGSENEGGYMGSGYGEDGEYGLQEEKKKNRPGQRARKAKAMAIEAKKAGRTWDASSNWREKKNRDEDYKNHDAGQKSTGREGRHAGGHGEKSQGNKGRRSERGGIEKPKAAQDIATMGKEWKEEGNAHPSWAAAAAKKSQGISTFKGTKITFD